MFSLPPLSHNFSKFSNSVDGAGRTTGGYTFVPQEHPRSNGGKFGFNGGSKPYIKQGEESHSEKQEEHSNKESIKPEHDLSSNREEKIDPFLGSKFSKTDHSSDRSWVNHYRNFPESLKSTGVQSINIEDLEPSQDYIIPSIVKNKMSSENKPISVIKLPNGHIMIEDGHHRVIAEKLKGNKTIKAKTYIPEDD